MTSAKITSESQKLAPDALVELYDLDLAPIGEPTVYNFTKSTADTTGTNVVYRGITYYPVDLQTEGWEYNGIGPFPTPSIAIANVFGFLSAAVYTYGDLVGARLTRIRTYGRFLDNGDDPDDNATFPIDVYSIAQKKSHTKKGVEFQLSAAVDQQGLMLPKRKILRDTCTHTYRVWNGETFDYSKATCPYEGANCFNYKDVVTTNPANDECSRELSGCKLRFVRGTLPTRAFPGIVRTKL